MPQNTPTLSSNVSIKTKQVSGNYWNLVTRHNIHSYYNVFSFIVFSQEMQSLVIYLHYSQESSLITTVLLFKVPPGACNVLHLSIRNLSLGSRLLLL